MDDVQAFFAEFAEHAFELPKEFEAGLDAYLGRVVGHDGLGAEEFADPGDKIVEGAKTDKGYALREGSLEYLAELKRTDRAAYENLRFRLRQVGHRVGPLDEAVNEKLGTGGAPRSQASELYDLLESVDLFHGPDGEPYCAVEIEGVRKTFEIDSTQFRDYLRLTYQTEKKSLPGGEAITNVVEMAAAKARAARQRPVFLRVGGHEGNIYIDIVDEQWRAIEITPRLWRIVDQPPVNFIRSQGMKPLPDPARGGSIMALKDFLNVKASELTLAIAWLLQTCRPAGPFAVLGLTGPFGTGKTTIAKLLRSIVDPQAMPLQKLPKDEQDLLVAARAKHTLAFDNISAILGDIADSICQLCTGGGLEKRRLYTNKEKAVLDAMRPVILNGIGDIINRDDLASRTFLLNLRPFEGPSRDDSEMLATFNAVHASILGALLDGLSHGLAHIGVPPASTYQATGRLPDVERWAVACLGAYPDLVGFKDAYTLNSSDSIDMLIENDAVATAIVTMMGGRTWWEGTSSELLDQLRLTVSDSYKGNRRWPTSPEQMGKALARVVKLLEKRGIKYTPLPHRRHRLARYTDA